MAKEAEANFISMKSSDLLSKWYGESEQQISRMFARARQVAPCVIFIDEIDSLVPARGTEASASRQVTARVVNTFLAEMDGMEDLNSIVLIGATNRPGAGRSRAAAARPLRRAGLCRRARRRRAASTSSRSIRATCRWPRTSTSPRSPRRPTATPAPTSRTLSAAPASIAIRRGGVKAKKVTAADFAEALADSRPTVTERDGRRVPSMRTELKRRAMEVRPIGFIHEGMLELTRPNKF